MVSYRALLDTAGRFLSTNLRIQPVKHPLVEKSTIPAGAMVSRSFIRGEAQISFLATQEVKEHSAVRGEVVVLGIAHQRGTGDASDEVSLFLARRVDEVVPGSRGPMSQHTASKRPAGSRLSCQARHDDSQ